MGAIANFRRNVDVLEHRNPMKEHFLPRLLLLVITVSVKSVKYSASENLRSIAPRGRSTEDAQTLLDLVHPYPLQHHYVTTEDGYILGLIRLPHGIQQKDKGSHTEADCATSRTSRKALGSLAHNTSKCSPQVAGRQVRPVVLLQHGLLDSCAGFLLAGQPHALAFMLADAGWDVWLGNSRGNTFSRKHSALDPDTIEFWRFSYDDMAQYDLPAELQYIRDVTGVERISYIGHSQGSTIMLAALASQPKLEQQLGGIVLLAPVAIARHVTSTPLIAMAALGTDSLFALLGVHEFLPSAKVISWLEGQLCVLRPDLCVSFLAAICGYREGAVNETRLPLYLRFTPAGTSVQNMAHWAQAVRGGSSPGRPLMQRFDFGTWCGSEGRQQTCNQERYGQPDPPIYHLPSISPDVRLALFSGGADSLANTLDVELLLEQLPEGVVSFHQHDPDLQHLDYIWGIDSHTRVYPKVLQLLSDAHQEQGGA